MKQANNTEQTSDSLDAILYKLYNNAYIESIKPVTMAENVTVITNAKQELIAWKDAAVVEARIDERNLIVKNINSKRYRHKHNHDIQTGFRDDDKYSCQFCRKTVDQIMGEDGLGTCPHFQSFNYGLNAAINAVAELNTHKEKGQKEKL